MLEAPATPDLGNRLRELQALWKEVGPMPQRRSKELWEQFKATCDQVYDKVKGVRAVEHEKFAEVAKAKEALIAEAEALAESTDWAATAEKLKALQAQWKQSGHLPRKQGDELWKRFRAACDRFFERRKPVLDARHAEEAANLATKQALIARAQADRRRRARRGRLGQGDRRRSRISSASGRRSASCRAATPTPSTGVPRRVRRAVRRSATRRAMPRPTPTAPSSTRSRAQGRDRRRARRGRRRRRRRARSPSARKARELGALTAEVEAMMRHVVAAHPDAVQGTELDPAQLRARREKLIARAEELLPKQPAQVAAGGSPADLAAQLKQAMRRNAFGDLRFSGRDPIEVVDELRASWAEAGPILDDADRAQVERFDDVIARVLPDERARAASPSRAADDDRADDREGGRRRRRDRRSAEQPIAEPIDPAASVTAPLAPLEVAAVPAAVPAIPPITIVPDGSASAVSEIATADELAASSAAPVPLTAHDAITLPAHLPPEPPIGVDAPAPAIAPLAPPPRRSKPTTTIPPMDELDTGWDLGDKDPTAGPAAAEAPAPPSSGEMAGDGAVEGDGLDQVD